MIRELFVIFLTDGCDGEIAETQAQSATLKTLLWERRVYSKFYVIGVGSQLSNDLLSKISEIGT